MVELAEEWGWRVVEGMGATAVLASASAGCDCDCGEGSLASEDGDSAATGDQNGFAPCKPTTVNTTQPIFGNPA